MEWVKEIELVFENTDSIKLDPKFFGVFQIKNISKNISRIGSNCIAKYDTAHYVAFELFREANKPHYEFGMDSCETTVFERIADAQDITSIEITYQDDTKDIFYVDFNGEYTNSNQDSYISKTGDLFVTIIKDKEVFEVFKKRKCDSKKCQDRWRSMLMH